MQNLNFFFDILVASLDESLQFQFWADKKYKIKRISTHNFDMAFVNKICVAAEFGLEPGQYLWRDGWFL